VNSFLPVRLIEPKFIKFLLVGGLNTLFGFAVYSAVYWATRSYVIAVVSANIIGPVFNFFTTGRMVFANSRLSALLPFLCGYAFTCVLNLGLIAVLVAAGVGAIWAQALCLPLLVLTSYAINDRLVFGERQ
jgi:putative flippase GtrA